MCRAVRCESTGAGLDDIGATCIYIDRAHGRTHCPAHHAGASYGATVNCCAD